jgi:hypothetical protein
VSKYCKEETARTQIQEIARRAKTCAHTAIVPRNSASEAKAAASSTIARIMVLSPRGMEHRENIVLVLFDVNSLLASYVAFAIFFVEITGWRYPRHLTRAKIPVFYCGFFGF